ncbi:hypothetical protein [Pelomonas cellulosilytica]|uniref:Uncharacterized protein n=1 Tax=Pelomonas cellulosilytica TaxID=2906762 RepID=A0ABS8XQW1_9BURK|nr:hypothetical protein [Pelomonas sp. P8]MCE4553138.1 hypothetical protein [Pelomonas sp. P8]
MPAPPPLASFWMGGYEGADHLNGAGEMLDMVAATGHDQRLDADYRAARRLGLRCVRESIGWRLCERPDGTFDFTRVVRMALAARRQGLQILWTVMHYGLPADLTLLDDALIPRFARFASEAARTLAPLCPGTRFYTPINEISFLSWAASATGDLGAAGLQRQGTAEDTRISGYQIKQRLVRAALAGMAAMRAQDPQCRFLHVEPVLHVAPQDAADAEQVQLARTIEAYQWQTFDMLSGRMDPGLGGQPDALDWLGLNHYHSSQWEVPGEKRLPWHLRDPRRQPLSTLLAEVWRRYRRPMIVAETGHIGVGRAAWLHEIAGEARRARAAGVPLEGVCLYPLLDRPDWNDTTRWHRSGLWHLQAPETRSLNRPVARALAAWQRQLVDEPTRTGLLLVLPCAWEDWRAPREALVAALSATRPLCVLEPPRAAPADTLLRQHTLAPRAELLVLHGRGASSWAEAPSAAQLALVRAALRQAGRERWVCWLAGWRGDGHPAWWRELQVAGVILQPDALVPPKGDVLRHARGRLPAAWPVAAARRPAPHGYDAEEMSRLLAGIPEPRCWLLAPPVMSEAAAWRLRQFAEQRPRQQLLVDASAPAQGAPWPANLLWLGPVHDSLHAALAATVEKVQPWAGPQGWSGPEPLAAVAEEEPDLQAALRTLLAHGNRLRLRAAPLR